MQPSNSYKSRLRAYSKDDNTVFETLPSMTPRKRQQSLKSQSEPRPSLLQYQYESREQGEESLSKMQAEVGSKIQLTKENGEVIEVKTPEDLTPQQWWSMYMALQNTLQQIRTQLENNQGNGGTGLGDELLTGSVARRLESLEEKTRLQEEREALLASLLIRQDEKLEEMRSELMKVKRIKARKNLVISGIIEDKNEKRQELMTKMAHFFKHVMQIEGEEVSFSHAQRLGQAKLQDRPVLIKLKTQDEKAKIYKHVANLKGKENVKKKLYFVDDDMNAEEAETKRIFRDLLKENKGLDDADKMDIKMNRGKIIVDNQIVKKRVWSPTTAELLKMTQEDQEMIKCVKLMPAVEHQEKDSDYFSYVHKPRGYGDVQNGLFKLRLKHADATHVSCAYRLQNAKGPFYQEGHDDLEPGAGRTILKVLKENNLVNICVYVVRYYGGTKLGNRRYQILQMLAEGAIATYKHKASERRSRQFRADSQESVISAISALSYEEVEREKPQDIEAENVESEENVVQQGEETHTNG